LECFFATAVEYLRKEEVMLARKGDPKFERVVERLLGEI